MALPKLPPHVTPEMIADFKARPQPVSTKLKAADAATAKPHKHTATRSTMYCADSSCGQAVLVCDPPNPDQPDQCGNGHTKFQTAKP